MRLKYTLVGVVCFLLAGCSYNVYNHVTSTHHPEQAGTDAALPGTVAEAPTTIQIPTHRQTPPLFRAEANGQVVRIYSNAVWHGRYVDIYFIPRQNIWQDGVLYRVRTGKNVQRITGTPIRPDGTWSVVWARKDVSLPNHGEMFLLAKSDQGEYGLVQINTRN